MKKKSACKTAKITILPKGPYELCGNIPVRQETMVED
jgi:hypothetical protein